MCWHVRVLAASDATVECSYFEPFSLGAFHLCVLSCIKTYNTWFLCKVLVLFVQYAAVVEHPNIVWMIFFTDFEKYWPLIYCLHIFWYLIKPQYFFVFLKYKKTRIKFILPPSSGCILRSIESESCFFVSAITAGCACVGGHSRTQSKFLSSRQALVIAPSWLPWGMRAFSVFCSGLKFSSVNSD